VDPIVKTDKGLTRAFTQHNITASESHILHFLYGRSTHAREYRDNQLWTGLIATTDLPFEEWGDAVGGEPRAVLPQVQWATKGHAFPGDGRSSWGHL